MREYGYGSYLKRTDSRIVSSGTHLSLLSGTPRIETEGRFKDNWDCFVAARWMLNGLNSAGIPAESFIVRTPAYKRDAVVFHKKWLGLSHGFLSVTPGVVSTKGMAVEERLPLSQLDANYENGARYGMIPKVSGTMTTLSAEEFEKGIILSKFGIYLDDPSVFELSIMTDLIMNGSGRGKHEAIINVPSASLASLIRDFGSAPEEAMGRISVTSWWPYDIWNSYGVPQIFKDKMEMNTRNIVKEYVPFIFKILDLGWASRF